jgi:nitrogen fixation NifU-like protein
MLARQLLRHSRGARPLFLAQNARQYHENIIDHFENPRNLGSMDKNDPNVGTVGPECANECFGTQLCDCRAALAWLQGLVGAPACGDVMKLQFKVKCGAQMRSVAANYWCNTLRLDSSGVIGTLEQVDENGKIVDAKFRTFGCGSAIASSSVATEWLKGKSVDECLNIKNTDIAAHLKLPPVKLHCR